MPADLELYIVFDLAGVSGEPALACLEAVLDHRRAASVLIGGFADAPNLRSAEQQLLTSLVASAQARGAAVLLPDDAALAKAVNADGVHLTWEKTQHQRYRDARSILGRERIVGADAGRSRHEAMELGEAGADYVAFGIPAHVEDIATAASRQSELLSWWSGVFEIPCVAFDVTTPAQAHACAEAGADFVTVPIDASEGVGQAIARVDAFWAAATSVGATP